MKILRIADLAAVPYGLYIMDLHCFFSTVYGFYLDKGGEIRGSLKFLGKS